jgi:hypothetical protein
MAHIEYKLNKTTDLRPATKKYFNESGKYVFSDQNNNTREDGTVNQQ